ncbi:MAG: hypothetical protein EOP50_14675 [Sphingobacteriales bacterium]|nr:MAG: hypothetical protein EOP50_14675 [Sphingobacteriales bacterium]
MRQIFVMLAAVAAVSCSRESALKEMSEANIESTTASTARTAAGSAIEGKWRLVETRYNRGNGQHYWQPVPPEEQTVIMFQNGKLVANNHYYLAPFYAYAESHPGSLTLTGEARKAEVTYTISGNTLELTYQMREDVTDRFVKN